MPKYNSRRYAKKKKYRKRQKARLVTKVLGGFPDRAVCNLKYVQEITLHAGVTGGIGLDFHRFRCNSIYDPDAETGGHQPANYNVWFARYKNATVVTASMKVTAINPETPTISAIGGILLTTDIGAARTLYTLGGYEAILEQRYSSHNTVSYGTRTGSEVSNQRMRSKFYAASFFNRPKNVITNSDEFSHNYVLNPTEMAYWTIWNASIGNTSGGTCHYLVEIIYTVHWSDPVTAQPAP